jgi:hypothetical protein
VQQLATDIEEPVIYFDGDVIGAVLFHRRQTGDPGHPRTSGHLACQSKAAAENPLPAGLHT